MRIVSTESWSYECALVRPYTIAFATRSGVALEFLKVVTDTGAVGYGSAAPAEDITGESQAACAGALEAGALEFLVGADPRELEATLGAVGARMEATPAARAAVDMAVHDLAGKAKGVSVAELLGQCHEELPTSITIGIKTVAETLVEAEEYLGRGFRWLKVKIGNDPEEDAERIVKLRERFGERVAIRVDMNQGYDVATTAAFYERMAGLDVEFAEQPLPAEAWSAMCELPLEVRKWIAADESLHEPGDAAKLAEAEACGIFNIKLMKCGGIGPAGAIAKVAEGAGIELMWGCMDESVVSISAALQAAFAAPATRYLDLDGSLDLADDPAKGGFVIEEGRMRLTGGTGLGVEVG